MNQGRTIATLMFVGIDNIIAAILNILLLLWTNTAAKAAVFLWNIYRSWMYSIAPIYIKSNFPTEYFGRLLGIMRITFGTCFLAVIGLAQIPNTFPSIGFKAVSGAFLAAAGARFIFPLHGLYKALRSPHSRLSVNDRPVSFLSNLSRNFSLTFSGRISEVHDIFSMKRISRPTDAELTYDRTSVRSCPN